MYGSAVKQGMGLEVIQLSSGPLHTVMVENKEIKEEIIASADNNNIIILIFMYVFMYVFTYV